MYICLWQSHLLIAEYIYVAIFIADFVPVVVVLVVGTGV